MILNLKESIIENKKDTCMSHRVHLIRERKDREVINYLAKKIHNKANQTRPFKVKLVKTR